MNRTFHEQPCNPSHIVAPPKPCNLRDLKGIEPAWCLRLEGASACGLRQGAVNAGGSQAGISGWGTFGGSILYFFVGSGVLFRVQFWKYSRPHLPQTPAP